MASTWSNLKFELIGTGDQSGTWGTTTNNNIGLAIEQAIGGKADVTMSSTPITLSLTDTTALQNARALYLNLTGTPGGAATLNVPAVQKAYIVYNNTTGGFAVTVKVSGQTGVSVPNGKTMVLYDNGTDVVDAITHLSSLTLGSALPIASGGTGSTSTTFVNLATNVTGDLPFSNLAQGSALSVLGVTGNATADVASIAAGTDNQVLRRSGTSVAFGAVNLASTDAVTGTLPVANGGTGATTLTANNVILGNGTSAVNFVAPGTAGNVLTSNGTTWTSAAGASGTVTSVGGTGSVQGLTLSGTVTSSGNLTLGGSLSAVSLTSQVSGTLPVGNGGSGATTLTGVLKGNGTSAFTASNVNLTSEVTGTLPVANGGTNATATPTAGAVAYGTGSAYAFTAAGTAGYVLQSNGSSAPTWVAASTGTVTAVSVTTSNGFAGSSSGGATPALTLSTTISGVLKGNGTAISAASAGTDYLAPPSGTSILKANSGGALANATAGTDYVAPGTATTFTALQTFSGSTSVAASKLTNAKEVATVSATAATGTINYDVTTQSVLYYTSNASANWTVNFRGSSGTSLDTLMSTGESMTVAFLVTQGSTAYYNSAVQVDGSSVTPKYQGGTAWSAGNASSIDAYVYTIVKTGSAAFTVFASQTRFA